MNISSVKSHPEKLILFKLAFPIQSASCIIVFTSILHPLNDTFSLLGMKRKSDLIMVLLMLVQTLKLINFTATPWFTHVSIRIAICCSNSMSLKSFNSNIAGVLLNVKYAFQISIFVLKLFLLILIQFTSSYS